MASPDKPSETVHVFLHEDEEGLSAYHGGKLISKKTRATQERFYADLHVWMRKNGYQGPFWRVKADGSIVPDAETAERASRAYSSDGSR